MEGGREASREEEGDEEGGSACRYCEERGRVYVCHGLVLRTGDSGMMKLGPLQLYLLA